MAEKKAFEDKWMGPEVQGTLLYLSAVQEDDYPLLYEWFSDASELHLWTNIRRPMSFQEFAADTARRIQGSVMLAVRDTATGKPIGLFQLYDMSLSDGIASFLVYIARRWREAEYTPLALMQFLSYAFRSYPLRKLYCQIHEFNARSIRGVQGFHFREEGRLRKHFWWRDRHWDLIHYTLRREEFEAFVRGWQEKLGIVSSDEGLPAPCASCGIRRHLLRRVTLSLAETTMEDTRNEPKGAPGLRGEEAGG